MHLDAVRGLAAFLVVIYHVRYYFFLGYADLSAADTGTRLFYVITSFGHDAVMVFFVLSGYLVGGSVLRDLKADRWSWSRYLTRRLVRLYVVLVPALLLTIGWDSLGLHLFQDNVAYSGAPQAWSHDFVDVRSVLTPTIAAKNLVFRHGFGGTPPLGTNVPLWSLTYEAAYYLMFPALATALWPSLRPRTRRVGAAVAAMAGVWFGARIGLYFAVWLLGVGVKALTDARPRDGTADRLWPIAAVVFCGGTVVRHTGWFRTVAEANELILGDFLVGLTFAWLLYAVLRREWPPSPAWYARTAGGAAAISYSLYATHMPLLILLRAWWNDGPSWAPDPWSVGLGVVATAAAVGQATVVFLMFERHTPRLQDVITRTWLSRVRATEPPMGV